MAFLSKEELKREAERLGVDLTGLSWQHQQKAVADALRAKTVIDKAEQSLQDYQDEVNSLKEELRRLKENQPVPQTPVVINRGTNKRAPSLKDYDDVVLVAAPEQTPTPNQPVKWYEKVGTDKRTREVSYDIRHMPFGEKESGTKYASYMVDDTGRPLIAESTMPKFGALLTWRPTKDLAGIAEFNGHRGYLWNHHRLPSVKPMLKEMGVFEEYKDRFYSNNHVFYLAGIEVCDIAFTDYMLKQLIPKELKRREIAESQGL